MNNNSWKWNITVAHPLPTGNNSHSARLIIHSYLIKCWWKSPRARDYAAHMAKTFLSKLDTAGAFGTMCNQSYRNALRELSLSLALWESTDSMSNLRKYHLDRKLCFYFLLETQNIYIYMYVSSLSLNSYSRNHPFSETCQYVRIFACFIHEIRGCLYRIDVIRSGNCMYDAPPRNLVAFGTRLPATKWRKRDV